MTRVDAIELGSRRELSVNRWTASYERPGFLRGFRAERWVEKPRGYSVSRNPLSLLVAGAGFEPATFGL
jgi:hypothetical protein